MQNDTANSPRIWTILDIINWTTGYFKENDVEAPRASAELFLSHILNVNRIDLYVKYDQPLTREELACFKSMIKRRVNREPVAYITGTKGFWSLDLCVSEKCLIPRPETEILVETALNRLPEASSLNLPVHPLRVLELGTGSGAIVLALAMERPGHLYFAADRCRDALSLACENARTHHLDDKILFFAGDWLTPVKSGDRFDLIISNPPYIPTDVIPCLQPEICRFEPAAALDGGRDGLFCIKEILDSAVNCLTPGGVLLLEIGHDQKAGVEKIVHENGEYENMVFIKDYAGKDRVVSMEKRR
jgi:release factor glutamine methyltransferase